MTTTIQADQPTDHYRAVIAEARELADVRGAALRKYMGEADGDLARARALGRAQCILAELAALAERLGGAE